MTATVVFLPGVGEAPELWEAQVASLPEGFTGFAPSLPGLRDEDNTPFSLESAAVFVRDELDRRGITRAHLCGHSLGAMVALRFALDHPERTSSLTLSAAQVHPPRALMTLQSAIMRLLPARLVTPEGMSRTRMLEVLKTVGRTDFRSDLPGISAPTLVLCGAKDRPNLGAARELAASIPDAELQIVPGAGHQWNTAMPHEFSRLLGEFLERHRP